MNTAKDFQQFENLEKEQLHVAKHKLHNWTHFAGLYAAEHVAIFPGDMLIGDDDGVMVIPGDIANEVADECLQMTLYEGYVMERVKKGQKFIGLYPLTNKTQKTEFEEWKKSRDQ
jgi:regulator of RNase E activity RraA